jgi:hypothetical protein
MLPMVRPLHIRQASPSLYATGAFYSDARGIICAASPSDACLIDLGGYTVLPGWVNAHDHLELNHYPRTKFRSAYANAHQWGKDVDARLDSAPFAELRAYPLWDRLFIGGLKNLLCGATTVVQHGAPHRQLFRADFPVRVLQHYGWAHSLHFATERDIIASYRATPPTVPWFIHLAEGSDDSAANEYRRLKALGCAASNTVIIHGVGLTDDDIADAARRVRGLVACPSTNHYLLGKTADAPRWIEAGGALLLGSDSRLTADGDFYDEQQAAVACWGSMPAEWVTTAPAARLNLPKSGRLTVGAYADWLAYTDGCSARRDIALIIKGGVPQIGSPDLMAKFPYIETIPALLDGVPKAVNCRLARQITRCQLREPGLEIDPDWQRQHTRSRQKWFIQM